jgi:hypothetical protein
MPKVSLSRTQLRRLIGFWESKLADRGLLDCTTVSLIEVNIQFLRLLEQGKLLPSEEAWEDNVSNKQIMRAGRGAEH